MQTELTELRVFLLRHGLRQEDMAEGIGLSRISLTNIILGKSRPRKDTIDQILAFCRKHDPSLTYEQLFGSVDAEPVAAGGAS